MSKRRRRIRQSQQSDLYPLQFWRERPACLRKVNRLPECKLRDDRDIGGVSSQAEQGGLPGERFVGEMVEDVANVLLCEEPGVFGGTGLV